MNWDPMNDRFNFRCGITISHYNEDGNDIDTFLLVNNVSLFYDGEVGIRKEDLEDAILKLNLNEEEKRSLWDSLDEYETYIDWYNITPDFIEQCTGLKDKKGKLIYEGDFIKENDIIHFIYWDNSEGRFRAQTPNKSIDCGIGFDWVYHKEIVGNIHENKEFLK